LAYSATLSHTPVVPFRMSTPVAVAVATPVTDSDASASASKPSEPASAATAATDAKIESKVGAGAGASALPEIEQAVVWLMRHGVAEHNVSPVGHTIPDPVLTKSGAAGALALNGRVLPAGVPPIDLIVASPLRRTLQTAWLAFGTQLAAGTPFALAPDAQEINPIPCDTGSPAAALVPQFPQFESAISQLPSDWWHKTGINAGTPEALDARLARLVAGLWTLVRERRAQNVVLVGHHGLFLRLTGIEFRNLEVQRFIIRDSKLIHSPLPKPTKPAPPAASALDATVPTAPVAAK